MTDDSNNQMSFTSESLGYLKESGSWGSFLAIVGFCYIAMIILLGLFANRLFGAGLESGGMGFMLGAVYICIGVIYFFPVLYLFRFSQEVKNALQRRSPEAMTSALANLKSLFKFMGILTVVGIAMAVMAIIGSLAGGFLM